MNNKRIVFTALVLFFIVALGAYFFINWLGNQPSYLPSQSAAATQQILFTPTVVYTPQPTITSTREALPVSGWKFEGFSDEKTNQNGYVYSWGDFINDNGSRIKAMCSAPNSPAPKVGDYYNWDKQTNILIPVQDNQYGNMQRFWYPTVQ